MLGLKVDLLLTPFNSVTYFGQWKDRLRSAWNAGKVDRRIGHRRNPERLQTEICVQRRASGWKSVGDELFCLCFDFDHSKRGTFLQINVSILLNAFKIFCLFCFVICCLKLYDFRFNKRKKSTLALVKQTEATAKRESKQLLIINGFFVIRGSISSFWLWSDRKSVV